MSRPVIAAIPLGCCDEALRCVLCAPAPSALPPDAIRGLVAHTHRERARPGQPVWVGFYGGRLPSIDELAATGESPVHVRVRPDRLSRAGARRLREGGVVSVELDVLTMDRGALRRAGRRYTPGLVLEQLEGLRALGFEVGAVLAPGLPETSFEVSLRDADTLGPHLDTARIHPVLVFRHSGLYTAMLDHAYVPLSLGEAVTVCAEMLDRFDEHGVKVLRVGQQPGPDGLGHVVSGPHHSSLRELVEGRRTLDALRGLLGASAPAGGEVQLCCAPADLGRVRGPKNQHVRTLRAEFQLGDLSIEVDPELPRGRFRVCVQERMR